MSNAMKKAEKVCTCLKGISHPTRLAILMELKQGPRSVGELVERLDFASQSNVSQHLSQMRSCGIVSSRRDGAQIFYEAADRRLFQFLDLLGELFCK